MEQQADGRRQWDVHLKRVVSAGLDEVLRAVGVEVPDEPLVPQNVELPVETRRVDIVEASESGLMVHVETQTVPHPTMAERMVLYAALLLSTRPFGRPVRRLVQIVVQMEGPPMTVSMDVGGLRTEVHLIHVPSTDPAVFLASESLAPLALSAGGADVVPQVVQAIAGLDAGDVRASALTLALQISPRLADNVVTELRRIGMLEVVEVMAELRGTDWGRGLLEEGRDEGVRAAVAALLARRFPEAPAADVARTADRLVREHGPGAAAAALDVPAPDA